MTQYIAFQNYEATQKETWSLIYGLFIYLNEDKSTIFHFKHEYLCFIGRRAL